MRIELPFLDVILSISADRGNRGRESLVDTDILDAMAGAGLAADPVFKRLVAKLDTADTAVDADAIRLALVARWLGLSVPAPTGQAGPPSRGALSKWRLKRVTAYVDEHIDEAIMLADLADAAGLSKMYFAAQFRNATGLRPHEYVLRRRIERAQAMLAQTLEPLVEVALSVGFQTQAHFTTVFKRFVGETPRQWRNSQRRLA